MRYAHENSMKVMIDGQGGDELFAGYKYYLESYLIDFFRKHKNPKILFYEISNLKTNSPINTINEFAYLFGMIFIKKFLPKELINLLNRKRKLEFKYLNKEFINNYKNMIEVILEIYEGLNNLLWQDMTETNLQRLLKWEDINSMAFSIESRTPFADDHKLIEFVFSIPACYKIHNGWMKNILRESAKGLLPDTIRLRKDKVGFGTSEKIWLIERKNEIKKIFIDKMDILEYYIDVNQVLENIDLILNQSNDYKFTEFWRFINFALWISD